ncbi:15010_t:CDS:2, partial [Funneliformis caledonium]
SSIDETCNQYKESMFYQHDDVENISKRGNVKQTLSLKLFKELNSNKLEVGGSLHEKYEDELEKKCSKSIPYGASQRTTKTSLLRDSKMNVVLSKFP